MTGMLHRTYQSMRGTSPDFSLPRGLGEQVMDLLLLFLAPTGLLKVHPEITFVSEVHGKSNRTFKTCTSVQLMTSDSGVQDPIKDRTTSGNVEDLPRMWP